MIRLPDDVRASGIGQEPRATVADLRRGEEGCVEALEGEESVRLRLLEIGFLPGHRVRVIRRAPLGCPLEIDLEGSRFSLRLETARAIRLKSHA